MKNIFNALEKGKELRLTNRGFTNSPSNLLFVALITHDFDENFVGKIEINGVFYTYIYFSGILLLGHDEKLKSNKDLINMRKTVLASDDVKKITGEYGVFLFSLDQKGENVLYTEIF